MHLLSQEAAPKGIAGLLTRARSTQLMNSLFGKSTDVEYEAAAAQAAYEAEEAERLAAEEAAAAAEAAKVGSFLLRWHLIRHKRDIGSLQHVETACLS